MVVLYSTHCPKCQIIEKKLQQKGISFVEENDVNKMLSMGIKSVPWLDADGELMDFAQANKWINEQ